LAANFKMFRTFWRPPEALGSPIRDAHESFKEQEPLHLERGHRRYFLQTEVICQDHLWPQIVL
jgi:hypothetical protein